MRKMIMLVVLVMVGATAFGQISVAVTANQDSINFGDEVVVNYQINVPQGIEITALDFSDLKNTANLVYDQYPEELDSIMDIDVVDGGAFKLDNVNLLANKERFGNGVPLQGSLRLRVSSVGAIFLPKPKVVHTSSASLMNLETPLLFIKPVGMAQELNPNYTIIEEEINWKDYLIYVYGVLGVILVGGGLYYLFQRVKRQPEEVVDVPEEVKLPADVIALNDLRSLREQELWQKGETKLYHTELTRIMRQYIEDRYAIQALEMTSSQLKREMNIGGISAEIIDRFNEILLIADKVKFAKGDAGPEINERFMNEAFTIVEETKKNENSYEAE